MSENFHSKISYTKYQWCYLEIYQNVFASVISFKSFIYPLYCFVFVFYEIMFGKMT